MILIRKEWTEMKKMLLVLFTLVASASLQAATNGTTALFKCEGDIHKTTDGSGQSVETTSITFEITPASGAVQISGWWGCSGSASLCQSVTMQKQTGGYSFEKNEEDANFSSHASLDLRGATGILTAKFTRTAKPPPKDKKPLVSWKTQVFQSELKCKVDKVPKG
jgi:hypothetical protein